MGSRALGAPLRRRSRDAHPAGDHPRHRRRPRAQGDGHPAGGLAPERRTRGVRRPAAHPRSDRRAARRSKRRSTTSARRRSSPRTRRSRPGTTRFPSAWSKRTSPARGARSAPTATRSSRSGHYDNGSGPLFNMTALALRTAELRQRRQPAARPGDARHVGADLAGRRQRAPSGSRDHQRHPRPDLAVARDGGAPRRVPAGGLARSRRRPGDLGGRREHSRRASCGRRGRRCGPISSPSCASARASGGRRNTSPPHASSPPARCSTRAR